MAQRKQQTGLVTSSQPRLTESDRGLAYFGSDIGITA